MSREQGYLINEFFPAVDRGDLVLHKKLSDLSRLQLIKRIVALGGKDGVIAQCLALAESVVCIGGVPNGGARFTTALEETMPELASKFAYVSDNPEDEETFSLGNLQDGDVVLFPGNLHHFKNPGALLKRVSEQLPSGHVVVMDGSVELIRMALEGIGPEMAGLVHDLASDPNFIDSVAPRLLSRDIGFAVCRRDLDRVGFVDQASVRKFLVESGAPETMDLNYTTPCPCGCGDTIFYWFASWEKKAQAAAEAA